jgi:ATP-binding cassette subfamily F protein uup
MLARLFAKPANVLVFDEPTNDLDIETLELLEELITDFNGTVLLVSHDRAFLDNIVTSTLAFEGNGRVVDYVGGWQDYLRQSAAARAREPVGLQPAPSGKPAGVDAPGKLADEPRTAKKRLSFNEQRELASLPAKIAALEDEQRTLTATSEGSDFYKESADRIRDVLARLEQIGPEIEIAMARWLSLEERTKN